MDGGDVCTAMLTPLSCALRSSFSGKFYAVYLLPQLNKEFFFKALYPPVEAGGEEEEEGAGRSKRRGRSISQGSRLEWQVALKSVLA